MVGISGQGDMHVNGAGGKGARYEVNTKATKRGARPGNAIVASSRYVCR